jgi:1,4-alpha-glucan branching enzyme
MPILTDFDQYLLAEGTHNRSFDKLGAHLIEHDGQRGASFAVWAPHAASVSVIGDFNGWSPEASPMRRIGWAGFWEVFAPGVESGMKYKYMITPKGDGKPLTKADPYAFHSEAPPGNASKVWDLGGHTWNDGDWMGRRRDMNAESAPLAVYECHLGSWRRRPEEGNRPLSYRELAQELGDYVSEMGFTHVEFLPLAEYPFPGSWGYQSTGYFSPTARFGTPQDLMALIDALHQRGIGVILDWVPAHFPDDPHGLVEFDGAPLYEYGDPHKGANPEWNTRVFDYNKPQVRNFLISNALYWLDLYHVDGLRVDAVSSMLYLDYGKKPGEWRPNAQGGRENLEAMTFLRQFNDRVHAEYPGVLTIAEETHGFPNVSQPTESGGLGFDLKWDVGWVHDTVNEFMEHEPTERPARYRHLLQRNTYAHTEHMVTPLSHDEVKPSQGSLLRKMPGDEWQKRANLRLLLGYLYTLPGKKLLFMGDEFGQWNEWDHDVSLDWHLLGEPRHVGIRRWVRDLNTTYRGVPALHEQDVYPDGIRWVEQHDPGRCVLAWLRPAKFSDDLVLVVANFTPNPQHNYRLGVPKAGRWEEILNSDATLYGGSGQGNVGGIDTTPVPSHGQPRSVNLVLPPLGLVALRSPR